MPRLGTAQARRVAPGLVSGGLLTCLSGTNGILRMMMGARMFGL